MSINKLGYKRNSPYKNRKSITIESDLITMDGVDKPLLLEGDNGQVIVAQPNSGEYYFNGATKVKETPINMKKKYKQGGLEQDILSTYLSTLKEKEQDAFIDSYSQMNPDEQYQTLMKCGGKVYGEGGIYIKPSKRGSLHKALGVPEGENIPVSKLQIKESDSPALKKKKQFALNARKWHQQGGMIDSFISPSSLNVQTNLIPTQTDLMLEDSLNKQKSQRTNAETLLLERSASQSRLNKMFDAAGDWKETKKMSKPKKLYERQEGGSIPIVEETNGGNVEVEGKETVVRPNGQLHRFEGPSHANGGIDVFLEPGSRVYSEHIKAPNEIVESILGKKTKKKYSYADLSKKFPTKPYTDILSNSKSDEYQVAGAEIKLANNQAMLDTIFAAQEMEKASKETRSQKSKMQEGGTIRFVPNGDGTVNVLRGNAFIETIPEEQQVSYTRNTASLPYTRNFSATDNSQKGWSSQSKDKIPPQQNVKFISNGDGTITTLVGNSFIEETPSSVVPPRKITENYFIPSFQPEQLPEILVEPSATFTTGVVPPLIKQAGEPRSMDIPKGTTPFDIVVPDKSKPVVPTLPSKRVRKKPVVSTKPVEERKLVDFFTPATDVPGGEGVPGTFYSPSMYEDDFVGSEPIENDYIGSEPLVDEVQSTDDQSFDFEERTKKKRNWQNYIPGSKLMGTLLDIGLAASDNLDVDNPNYRDNRKYPIFSRFVNFDDKEVSRNYASALQEIQNSNVPEQVKQTRAAELNAKYQDYQAKIDFANAQRYQNKLDQDTNKLQSYMDRNIDQATQDLNTYREKKARVNYLVDQFKAQRKSRIVNSVRGYLNYVDETNQKNQLLSKNYRVNPFTERIQFTGTKQDPFAEKQLQIAQYARDSKNVIPIEGTGASIVTLPDGTYVIIDKEGRVTKPDK